MIQDEPEIEALRQGVTVERLLALIEARAPREGWGVVHDGYIRLQGSECNVCPICAALHGFTTETHDPWTAIRRDLGIVETDESRSAINLVVDAADRGNSAVRDRLIAILMGKD